MQSIKNFSITATAAMIATVISLGAAAAPVRAETPTAKVSYADLDLSNKADAAKLHRRIRYAAQEVCGDIQGYNRFHVIECQHKAITNAEADVRVAMAKSGGVALAAR
jgi:UrcA family protein